MGVRNLSSLMRNELPGGFIKIDMEKEIQDFKKKNNIQPVIVIDLSNFISFLNRNKYDLLCGARHKKYCYLFNTFFMSLKEAGAELVFFRDGSAQPSKNNVWCNRQDQNYKNSQEILKRIANSEPLNKIIQMDDRRRNTVINLHTYIDGLEEFASDLGTFHISISVDCDLELAEYATKNNAMAIMTDDSDFLIFQGNWACWSIDKINEKEMTTMKYDRVKLRRMLMLQDRQMPILATIAGNDIILYHELKNFHKSFVTRKSSIFWKMAEFINTKLNSPSMHTNACEIAKTVLKDSNPETILRVKKSLASYNLNYKSTTDLLDPLLEACYQNHLMFPFEVLRGSDLKIYTTYYDMRFEVLSTYSKIQIAIFRRQFGVLLDHQKSEDLHRIVHFKQGHNIQHKAFKVKPNFPPEGSVPPLMDLLFLKDNSLLDKKFKLLKWIINADEMIQNCNLDEIPKEYLVDVLVLVFLVKNKMINVQEADLILLTIKNVIENSIPVDLAPPEVLNQRAFQVSFIFTGFYCNVRNTLCVVGLNESSKILDFDGVFFHNLYIKHSIEGENLMDDLKKVISYRLYDTN